MHHTKEIIPISTKLPRGLMAQMARKHNLSKAAIKYIADGLLDRPEIYAELLKEHVVEMKRREEMDRLREQNRAIAQNI